MQKKYFFFDIDGTLESERTRVVPLSTLRCIRKLRENGHFTAIASGRLQASAAKFGKMYGFDNIVADGGYSITINGKILEMRSLPVEPCKALLARLDRDGIPWAVTLHNESSNLTNNPNYPVQSYYPTDIVPDFDYRKMERLYKIHIACTPEEEKNIDFGDLPTVRYQNSVLFIEPKSKQEGIRRMMGLLGADTEDAVVFGDGYNDLCMFGQEWISIAMGNAREELKRRADYVTTSVDRRGIWNACRHFGWI